MLQLDWDEKKNEQLKISRNVTFEQVETELEVGRFRIEQNTSRNHTDQKIYLVILNGYIHVIPFREDKEVIFLITIFPSRYWQEKLGGVI